MPQAWSPNLPRGTKKRAVTCGLRLAVVSCSLDRATRRGACCRFFTQAPLTTARELRVVTVNQPAPRDPQHTARPQHTTLATDLRTRQHARHRRTTSAAAALERGCDRDWERLHGHRQGRSGVWLLRRLLRYARSTRCLTSQRGSACLRLRRPAIRRSDAQWDTHAHDLAFALALVQAFALAHAAHGRTVRRVPLHGVAAAHTRVPRDGGRACARQEVQY